jgi:hypothetical protein
VRSSGFRFGYINVKLPVDKNDLADFWDPATPTVKFPHVKVSFEQNLTKPLRNTQYRGRAGNLTLAKNPRQKWDASGRQVTLHITTFGEQDYCGGYHSPLLVYFDDSRSNYNGISDFNLFGSGGQVYWPEKGSKAFFLTLDRNKNGIIDRVDELFGNVAGAYENGFEALKKLDSNNDKVIDEKDPAFSQLLLWNDSTGRGHCKKKDLYTLAKKGVQSISLDYKRFIRPFGGRAEERAEASFFFKQKVTTPTPELLGQQKGEVSAEGDRIIEGKVIDVWFARPTVLTSR